MTRSSMASTGFMPIAVNADNKAELRRIKVSKSIDGRSVVDEGLSPGQQVIIAGQYKVQPGAPVAAARREARMQSSVKARRAMNDGISAPFIRYPIGNLVADGGHPVRRPRRLSAAAGRAAAAGRFPDHPGLGAACPARSPETMASSVAQPLERQLAQIPGVAQMTSTSSLGTTAVTIQFDLNRNIDGAANDVQAAINAAGGQLPKNLPSPPTYRKVNPADSPILLLSATSDTLPLTEVSATRSMPSSPSRSARFPASRRSRSAASRSRRSAIQIDPAKLVAKGLSLEDVRSPDRDHDRRQPKGNIDGATRSYTIYANDQLTGLQGLERRHHRLSQRRAACAFATSAAPSPGPEDAKQAAWADGKRGVFLIVFKQPGANVIDTVDKIKAAAAAAARGDPARHQDRHSSATAPRPSAPRSRTCNSRCC